MLGYKRVPGMCIYRVRIRRGGRKRPERKGVIWGNPANHGINQIKHRKNLQHIAEERAGRTCANMRVMNSYWVTEDGNSKWYEVVMIDPRHKRIREDPLVNWICGSAHKHREMRGLTSAGRKHRGLRKKDIAPRRRDRVRDQAGSAGTRSICGGTDNWNDSVLCRYCSYSWIQWIA